MGQLAVSVHLSLVLISVPRTKHFISPTFSNFRVIPGKRSISEVVLDNFQIISSEQLTGNSMLDIEKWEFHSSCWCSAFSSVKEQANFARHVNGGSDPCPSLPVLRHRRPEIVSNCSLQVTLNLTILLRHLMETRLTCDRRPPPVPWNVP